MESSLTVEMPAAEHLVDPWRRRYDPVTLRGIPGHVTALYPFVAPARLDDDVIARVRRTTATIDAFTCELTEICEFPGVLWLMPSPDAPFRALTAALSAEFPETPPFGGMFPDPQPHLTLGLAETEADQRKMKAELISALAESLPIACSIDELSLFTSDAAGTWTRQDTFRLRQAHAVA